ncbi:Hypothetical predicted protein [Olea europaea subsp. europaea]|uniref:Uncharacterized protein n=1 Tax=Olea europaea subsp. europaea TaxID=158383 RepID=A0A8S0VKR2_OLEEU|nr:Hypothetical predicted protein [Olea europaea subsp. europaea]
MVAAVMGLWKKKLGACKFEFYEFFTGDVAFCPFEAAKVNVQTRADFARALSDRLLKFVRSEGTLGYKGLVPLWGRQIPYTMMKFASFDTIVGMIYRHSLLTVMVVEWWYRWW